MRWCRAQTLLALQKLISERVSTGARSWHGFYTEELTLRLVHLAVLIQWRLNAKTPRRQDAKATGFLGNRRSRNRDRCCGLVSFPFSPRLCALASLRFVPIGSLRLSLTPIDEPSPLPPFRLHELALAFTRAPLRRRNDLNSQTLLFSPQRAPTSIPSVSAASATSCSILQEKAEEAERQVWPTRGIELAVSFFSERSCY
jgi:hypothetical protein